MQTLLERPASTGYELHPLILNRWSPRAFDPSRPIETGKVCSILEAARWAPSCFNDQPWRFVIGHRTETPQNWETLFECLVEANQVWVKNASLLMLSVARLNFAYNNEPNRHAIHDVGLATENMVLQALHLGIATHQMAGFHVEKARELLSIPPGYEPVTMIAFGYPGELSVLPEKLQEREQGARERITLQEMAFTHQWGTPYPVCFT